MSLDIANVMITNWDQLKADQASILLFWRDKLMNALHEGKTQIAGYYKAIIVGYLCRDKKLFKQLSSNQVVDIADDLNFIKKPWYSFHVTYIKTKYGTIHRPDLRLASFTFFQLVKADAEYSRFLILNQKQAAERMHALNRLVAIIYQTKPGRFTDTNIEDYAKVLPKALTFDLKYLILHTYSNIRKYLVTERCKDLFNQPETTEETGPSEPIYTGEMWQQMLFDLAETPAFHGLEVAKNARMFDALDYLNKKAKQNAEMKKS